MNGMCTPSSKLASRNHANYNFQTYMCHHHYYYQDFQLAPGILHRNRMVKVFPKLEMKNLISYLIHWCKL